MEQTRPFLKSLYSLLRLLHSLIHAANADERKRFSVFVAKRMRSGNYRLVTPQAFLGLLVFSALMLSSAISALRGAAQEGCGAGSGRVLQTETRQPMSKPEGTPTKYACSHPLQCAPIAMRTADGELQSHREAFVSQFSKEQILPAWFKAAQRNSSCLPRFQRPISAW